MSGSGNILHQRWRALAAERADQTAWTDAASGKTLSFGELAEAAGRAPVTDGPILAQSTGIELLVQTLQAWRDEVPLVPIETGTEVDADALRDLPPGIAHVKQTSGSTGVPRWVLFDAGQLAADADHIMETMGLGDRCANLGIISLAHSYGFSNLVLPLLLHGVPLVTAANPLPAVVAEALVQAGEDVVLPAVPAMWAAWHSAGILDASRVGLAISAGAPLHIELERAVHEATGIKIHNFYGSSECGGIAYDRSLEPRSDPSFVGQPLAGVDVSTGDDGTLVVRSAAVGTGYWPEAAKGELADGRFRTSDLARVDAEGSVHLLGRADDLINVAGRKVAPQEIEAALSRLEGVDCCVVFGVPSADRNRVEEIVACVRSSRPEKELAAELRSTLPGWHNPKRWWMCKSLAPNARGKISRDQWRQKYVEGQRD